jgi:HD-GYP domain-containing protein (c-di-GMP phosphodiesterase class II)
MTSDRPYRGGLPPETVERVFLEGAGIHWDPHVVRAYFRLSHSAEARSMSKQHL